MTIERRAVYLDAELARAVRDLARATGRPEHALIEDALRRYLGAEAPSVAALLSSIGDAALSDNDALALARAELRAVREERRR